MENGVKENKGFFRQFSPLIFLLAQFSHVSLSLQNWTDVKRRWRAWEKKQRNIERASLSLSLSLYFLCASLHTWRRKERSSDPMCATEERKRSRCASMMARTTGGSGQKWKRSWDPTIDCDRCYDHSQERRDERTPLLYWDTHGWVPKRILMALGSLKI